MPARELRLVILDSLEDCGDCLFQLNMLVQGVLYCILEPLAASINPSNDHWALRDYAARLLAQITRYVQKCYFSRFLFRIPTFCFNVQTFVFRFLEYKSCFFDGEGID